MDNKIFYFVARVKTEQGMGVTVIDLSEAVDYQRNDWDAVNDFNHESLEGALAEARLFAFDNDVPYVPYESRYDESTNEPVDGEGVVMKPKKAYSFYLSGFQFLGRCYPKGSRDPLGDTVYEHSFYNGDKSVCKFCEAHDITLLNVPILE